MADNVEITPGTGADIASDDVGGVHFQKVKLDIGGDGASVPATGDAANGLDVDVTRIQDVVHVDDNAGSLSVDDGGAPLSVDDNAGSLTVDAPVATPVAVRQSDGAAFVDPALEHATAGSPHSARLSTGAAFYDAAKTGQLPAALVGTRLDVNIGACPATQPVSDAGASLTVDDGGAALSVDDGGASLTVDGTVTGNQGTAAAVASGWPVKVTDGADTVGISTVGAAKAIKVDVIQAVGSSAHTDKAAFTEGTTKHEVIGGVFNDAAAGDPAEDQAAAARITAKRALHVNIRSNGGTEMGTAGDPFRVDPTGTTNQPTLDTNSAAIKTAVELIDDGIGTIGAATPAKAMTAGGHDGANLRAIKVAADGSVAVHDNGAALTVDGTLATTQSGAWTADITKFGGAAVVAAAAGIPKVGLTDEAGATFSETNAVPVRCTNLEKTPKRYHVTYPAAQTAIAVWTPAAGKKFILESIIVSATGAGVLKFFDNTDAAANMISCSTFAVGDQIQFSWPNGHPSSTANNVLRYTSGAGAAGDFTIFGYESD